MGGDFEKRAYGILEIYQQNKDITIITSGFEGEKQIAHAIENKERFIALGIPKEQIIAEPRARDTKEEAQYVKQIVKDAPLYLVTSSYHMPRALEIFKHEGLEVVAYPIGELSEPTKYASFFTAFDAYISDIALHEYIGMLWAKLVRKFQ